MFDIADTPALAAYFTIARVRRLSVAADGSCYALDVDATAPDGRSSRSVWVNLLDDRRCTRRPRRTGRLRGGRSVRFDGSQVALLPGRCAMYLAPATSHRGAALWWRSLDDQSAHEVVAPPGGVTGFAVAADAGCVVYGTAMHPGLSGEEDVLLRRRRSSLGTTAVLYEDGAGVACRSEAARERIRLGYVADPRSGTGVLLPEPPKGRLTGTLVISRDGTRIVAERTVERGDRARWGLVCAERAPEADAWRWRTLAAEEDYDYFAPVLSPDGGWLACQRVRVGRAPRPPTAGVPPDTALWLIELTDPSSGSGRRLAAQLDVWPTAQAWSRDGDRLFFTADRHGSRPVYQVDIATGRTGRLTGVGHYSDVQAVDGWLYAVRSAVDHAPSPVLLKPEFPAGCRGPYPLTSPGVSPAVPGRLQRVSGRTADGSRVSGWLCVPSRPAVPALPPGLGTTPLLVSLHGGPYATWNAWSWRWNPWLAVARGYAVLMPDPAPSTGYGQAFVARAWADWSGAPYTDFMALVDQVSAREDLDETRMAVMGSSFGGYLVNLAVTRSNRFRAGVSHAGIWDLRTLAGGSLVPRTFIAEFGHPMEDRVDYLAHTPRTRARSMNTPLLISHGGQDPKVPFTEALTLWSDLRHLAKPVKFMQFPDEAHDIVRPGNIQLWYQCVFAFLDHTLNGRPWRRPSLL